MGLPVVAKKKATRTKHYVIAEDVAILIRRGSAARSRLAAMRAAVRLLTAAFLEMGGKQTEAADVCEGEAQRLRFAYERTKLGERLRALREAKR